MPPSRETLRYAFHVDPREVADPSHSEQQVQAAFKGRLVNHAPAVRLVASMNGLRTTVMQGIRAKQTGMSRGFPDCMCIAPGIVAFLEFKTAKGSLDAAQVAWLNWLHNAGFACGVFRSADTALEWLRGLEFPFIGGGSDAV